MTEVIAAGGSLSATVRDAALARASRLPAAARQLLDAAAVIGTDITPELLLEVGDGTIAELESCIDAGILRPSDRELHFRHEIGRLAILQAISVPRASSLHRRIMLALERVGPSEQVLGRLAHHAEGAGDRAKTLEYSLAAGDRSADLRSHREAAAFYGRALSYGESLSEVDRSSLLVRRQRECLIAGDMGGAIEAIEAMITSARTQGDRLVEAEWLARISAPLLQAGRNAEGEAASRLAVEIVQVLPVGRVHALAYRYQSALRMLDRDLDVAVSLGARALELAEQFGDSEMRSGALNTLGTTLLLQGDDGGKDLLERAFDVALAGGFEMLALNALGNLGSASGEVFKLDDAERYLRRGLEFAEQRDLSDHYLRAWLALVLCYRGVWTDSSELALNLLKHPGCPAIARIAALIALGRARIRRGDPEGQIALEQALSIAGPTTTLQRIAPVQAARAEAAWLAGELHQMVPELRSMFDLAAEHRHVWFSGELGYWLWRAGEAPQLPDYAAEPYRLELEGNGGAAASAWETLGAPYEAARARLSSRDASELDHALATCERLGARPLLQMITRRRRELGLPAEPRGPRPSTRSHPAGLTSRELECLTLLSQGLRNAEIAERMFVSLKTVEHHLSAIFRKLGVSSRMEAGNVARDLLGGESGGALRAKSGVARQARWAVPSGLTALHRRMQTADFHRTRTRAAVAARPPLAQIRSLKLTAATCRACPRPGVLPSS